VFVPPEYGHTGGHDLGDVLRSVAIEIADGEDVSRWLRRRRRKNNRRSDERPIASPQQRRCLARRVVSQSQIEIAVAIEIRRNDQIALAISVHVGGANRSTRVEAGGEGGLRELTVACVAGNEDGVALVEVHSDVGPAVAVEVRDDRVSRKSGRRGQRGSNG